MRHNRVPYRNFGKTGWQVSEIGFGGWAIGGGWGSQDDEESVRALHTALDRGVNFIDTAAGYGDGRSEKIIGRVLRDRSERVYVTTKTPPVAGPWPPSPYCVAEERLSNLGVEAIDVLLLHTWTRAWNADPAPLRVLSDLRDEGKIVSYGTSTPEHDQNSVVELMKRGLIDAVQVIYNIFEQEPAAELLPVAREQGVGVIVRVAFDEGSLTGKFTMDTTFDEGGFRSRYFTGDRLRRTVERVEHGGERRARSGRRYFAETARSRVAAGVLVCRVTAA